MESAVDHLGHLDLDLAVGGNVETDVDRDVVGVGHLHSDVGALGDVVGDVDGVALRRVLNNLDNLIFWLLKTKR